MSGSRHPLTILLFSMLALAGCGQPVDSPDAESVPAVTVPEPEPPPGQTEPFVPSMEIEADDFEPEEGFTRLMIEDFTPFQPGDDTWQEIDGVIVCSGEPRGYLHSANMFGNFTWRAEYRFAPVDDDEKRPLANTGFMIHIQTPHTIWPRSLEVQGRWDQICSIKANGGADELAITDDAAARESARRPVGEWNAVEIVSNSGGLTATLNGKLICTSAPSELTEGFIGLQSERFEVHFRRMRVREDD